MPDKKYLIEIPGMPEGSGVWDADKWERNKDIFMEDYPDANVFELGAYDADDTKETDQIMLDLGIEEMSGVWDNAKWERNKDVFMQDHPEAKVSRVRYVDYWGQKAEQNRAQKALLQQPNEERNAKLAELGYYDDITGGQVDFSFNAPSVIGLKPLSSAVETTATGETTYHDPRVKEFFANDTAETDRLAEMARLDAEYDANPSVIAQREWEAQVLAERKAYAGKLEEQIKKDLESEVDAKHAGLGAVAKYSNDLYGANQMTQAIRMIKGEDVSKDVTELEKQERYTSALKFLEKAKIARDVAGKGMGGAIIDWAKEGFMDAGTQSDIEAYNEIGDILTRLEKELGNLKEENLSEEVFDKYLNKDEQALIKAFYEYNLAMAEAQQDMSRAYKGGKIFAESIPFMLEFLVTGGVYRAAGRAATSSLRKHYAKWIAKSAAKTFARKAKVATTKIVSGAIKAGAGTLARTVAAPGTYDRMAEASIKIDDEGHLHRAKESAVAFADMYVENLSEISGDLIGDAVKFLGMGAGYLAKGTGKLLDKGASKWLGKTPFATLGNAIGDNARMQQLAKAWGPFTKKLEALGFHGLPEEIGEEYIGNAIREIAHIQPGALKEMTEDDNFGAMLIGFAPMTLLGIAGGAISLGVVNAKAAKMGKDLREMFGNTYSAAELDHMMGVIQNAQTAEEVQRALKPYAMAVANAEADGKISADEAAEQIEMLYQYGGFMAQYNTLLFGKKAQDRQMMDAKREEFTNQYGRFWQEDQNETVQIATLNNGSTVFVTSAPAADGMIAIVDAMTGKKGFANVSDILTQEVEGEEVKASNSMTMDAFLNSHIATQRKTAEETRMNNERNAQIEALAAQITPGTKINLGTEGSPVYVFAKRTNKNGVVVVDETGMESLLGWEQAADALGKPIIVETDQQKLDAEISARLQRLAERRARRKPSPAVQATEEAAEGAAETVAQEQTHIPMNEDGTVNEAAFWTQDPEGYVKWNDEQNKDGGQDSLRQIAISKQELMGMLNEVATGQNTSNPTMRKAAEKQVAAIAEKIARLEALEMSYADALAEEKEAIKQTQATPTATMSEEDLVKMDEQYQSILGKTRIQSERDRVMQEYLDKLAENSIPAILLTMENYAEVMEKEGCADFLIESVREQVDAGSIVAGFMANGKVFLMAEGLASIESGRVTYVHERQHTFNRANPQLVQRVAEALGSKEAALAILKTFVGDTLNAYKDDDLNALADEIICRSMEIAYTTEEFSVDLQSRGIPSEVISIITEIDNEQRQDQSLSHARRRSGRNSHADIFGAGSVRQDGRDIEQISGGILEQEEARSSEAGERGDEVGSTGEGAEVSSENNAVPFRIVGEPEDNLSNETKQELADKGLVMDGGVIMSDDYADLKHEAGYLTPIEEGATTDDVRFSVVTMPGWKQNYLKYQDADERIVRVLEAFADRITANELVNGVIAQGKHKSSKKTKDGRLVSSGPLRSNISYVVTFDLDTSCPRTFQYLNYVRRIERRIGRPLTQIECIQLNEMMRMYGQQIPCVYCYAENKRQAMKQYFNNYIESRHAVLSAETDEEALEHMYGHEAEGTDPKTVLTEAAYKVFTKWRKNPKGTYNPTMRVLWHQYDQARNSVLSLLDMKYAEGSINTDAADETLSKIIAGELGVSNKTAIKAIEEIVVEWKWNTIEGQEHDDFTRMDEDDLWANENALEVWRDMTLYAKSASGAKNVNRYVPYTDELKNVDQATRDYINGMGGLRMHSTNDFRIDYVFDYFQFLADMAAAKMFGHTYTKSPEFVRIFGNSGYKINMSIAAYQDENGVIRPNVDEGFDWNEAKELRRLFPHAGTMLMATSDEQLQMALDSEWIDMCIPFHHSGLPKAVWYNMRLWTDYTTVQNERYFNNDERIAMLAEAGVELPKKISTENVEEIFNEHFGIKVLYGKSGKRVKPHFLPGPTIVDGVDIPGHNNDHKRYLELCKEYGVKPRFEGIKVKDNTPEGGGRIVDITEHPRYMILVKETARTDTPQTAIEFNFDQPSEALGGKTPMDYAFDELEARAMAESDLAGGKVKDIYTSLKQDQFGIVDQFLNTIIKHKEETGEDYPMDYLTPESREWFLVQRKAFEEAFKDIETIPYHRNEYDEQGNLTKGEGLEREEPIDLVSEAEKAFENDVMMRVIGEQAAQRLDNSRKANVMMGALETAKQMADAGKEAKAIKMATGWEKAADGLWRYEQPDFEMKAKHGRQKTFQLKRLISDKSLFTEYPILNDVKVVYMQLPAGERGRVVHVNGKPEIQVSIDAYKEQNPIISKAIYDFTKKHADIAQTLGETRDMGSLTPEQKKVVMDELGKLFITNQPFTDKVGGKDILVHEIQHIIQAEEGFALGGNEKMLDTTDPKVRAMVDYFIKEVEAAEQEMQRLRDEARDLAHRAAEARRVGDKVTERAIHARASQMNSEYTQQQNRIVYLEDKLSRVRRLGLEGYKKLAGEVEARNVADRIYLSEEERRNTLLSETEDVAREDQIFLRNNVMMKADEYQQASVRFRFVPRTEEQREQLFDAAKAKYGTTTNFNATGYMLPDGSLLDFSEANDGGDPNRRSLDHRDVEGIIMDEGREYDSRYDYIVDFVDEGAIRMLPEAAGFQLSIPPTKEQRSRLMDYFYKHNGEVIMEITDQNGSPRVYMEYNKRTSPSRIFKDMDEFFNNGTTPGLPPLRFRITPEQDKAYMDAVEKGDMETAQKMVDAAARDYQTFNKVDFELSGGMSGFYDKMLPAFMNKYGKKWGVKVEDIELPNLEDGLTMHSVPVTEEMKASVMEGQVMFRTTAITPEVQEEMDAIHASAIVMGNFMKAPNGKDTNLTEEQWLMVRTKNFLNWFGDWLNDPENASKVVDENGEPKVVYHGSPNEFNAFDEDMIGENTDSGFYGRGFYFATTEEESRGYGKYVIPAYLSMQNPLDLNELYAISDKWDGTTAEGAVRWWYGLASMFPNDAISETVYASIGGEDWTIMDLKNRIDELAETSETPFADAAEEFGIDEDFFDMMGEEDVNLPDELTDALKANGYDGVINAGVENNELVALYPNQIKSATDNTGEFSSEDNDIRYRVVTDLAKIEELENGPKIKVYRAMQLIDGKLYPPMSAKVDGKLREPIELGQWEEAEERPDLADNKGYFKLNKGNKKSIPARYNPYFHTSPTPLNDQFSSAQDRPNLVTVEVEIPASELTSGYKADKAKDSVGEQEWKAGVIQSKLSGTRKVILSRWDKPVRIVPDSEVADVIVKMFEGKDITMPSNVVTPSLRAELEKRGVPFVETDNNGKSVAKKKELLDVIRILFTKGKQVAAKMFSQSFFDVADTPEFMKTLGLTGSKFTVRYGVIARHFGKDGSHDLTEKDWNELPAALQTPFAITKIKEEEKAFRIYTSLRTSKGEYVVVGVDVKNAGRELEVNAISTLFGRRSNASLTQNEEVIYKSKNITPEQSSLLKQPNSAQYPTGQEPSANKGSDNIDTSNESDENISLRVIGTPTEDVVAEGVNLSKKDLANLAGDIFAALPEESRKKITDSLNGNVLGLKDAILQIPASLASKENWNEEDKQMAAVVRDVVQDLVDVNPTTRPLTTKEALWMLYDSTSKVKDLVDAASRAFVAYNLGFDPASMQRKQEVSDYLRFRTASNGAIDAATDMYNYETSLWTERLKESWLDMNQSVVSLQKAMAEASGMPIEPWENLEFALNRLSSKSYADKKKYLRDFLMPMWDAVMEIVKVDGKSIEEIERYMMLKHGLERNKKFATRDAKDFYRTMYDLVAERMKNQSHAQQVVALSEAKKKLADIDAQIAVASSSQLPRLNEARARAQYDVNVADLVLRGDEKQNETELQAYYDAIDNGADPKYREFREKDYGGLTSMFVDTTEVQRSQYKSEEAYQKAVLAATTPKFTKVADMEAEAQAEVDYFEKVVGAKNLWDKVNAATKETLRHQYESGMITIEQYEAVRDMFDFYVPLRGFADNTAEDMYSYYMNNSAGGFTKPILGAKGRKTRAESPLGWIGTMAESAIQSDNKNQAKMALYYMTLRRPDQNLLTITETWYEYTGQKDANGKKIFKAAYPPATDRALNADELRQHMEDWEDDMKKKQSRGEAYKSSQRVDLKGSVVFQDEKEEKEHIVRVKVAGKDYNILINGNPRAAQAINGLLNPDANVGPVAQWIGDARRNLSALLTSYSPLFWVANYQRDLLASTMRVSEADGWDMAMKYLANRRHAWRVASYVYKYDAGELGNSYYENLYREFAENGGITGYTSLTTNKEYEKLLEDYAKNVDRKVLNAVKGAFDKFMGFGEAIEQVTRFAAYITARESGKSIEEAVNAAKEVSVNFNRKGSAKPISLDELKKLRTKDGKELNAVQKGAALVLSAMPGPMKYAYYFVNASIQAISSNVKLMKKSPGKAATWIGMYMGTSIALAMINYLLSDDDDDEYLSLPDYLRHSTILVKVADGYYFKWSIPQEMRPFYAWADILVRKMMGKSKHKNGFEVGKEMGLAAMQWLPVNPFEAEDPLLSIVPDFLSPWAELKANQNAFGGKIYDDMPYKSEGVAKEIPAYRKATEKTGEVYVDMAEFLNDVSGGNEVEKGFININPAMVEHLVEGYGGGIYDFAKLMVSVPSMIFGDEPVEVKKMPFVNKVVLSVDETNMYSHTNEAFRHYKDVADNAKRVEKEYRESDDPSRADAYREEEDWRIYLLYKQYEQDFKNVKERLDNAVDKEEEDLLKQEQNVLREMFLNDIAKGDVPEVTFQIREDVKRFDKEIKAIMKPVTDANKERLEKRRAGDVDGMLKAIERRDSLKDTPEYQRAEELNEDLKKIKQQLKELGSVERGSQRDSVIGELQKNYDAIVRKMEQL